MAVALSPLSPDFPVLQQNLSNVSSDAVIVLLDSDSNSLGPQVDNIHPPCGDETGIGASCSIAPGPGCLIVDHEVHPITKPLNSDTPSSQLPVFPPTFPIESQENVGRAPAR
jgi:hypothetical protein